MNSGSPAQPAVGLPSNESHTPSMTPPATPTPVPPPRPTRRKPWLPLAAVVVAVGVVIATLFEAGGFNSNSSGSERVGIPVDYSAAVPLAAQYGQSASGGPWTVVAAEGIGVPTGITQPNTRFLAENGCTFSPAPGGTESVSVLATPSNATPGKVASWIFFATNASLNVVLLILVNEGTASALVLVTGCSEVANIAGLSAVSAQSVVDSTTVASEFDQSAGGASFLANHTSAVQLFSLIGPSASPSGSPGGWSIFYTSCGLTPTGGSGSWIQAGYDANSGALLGGPSAGSGAC